ncbi:hypothetical protein SSX86_017416 [Deinandra increscens subsp. villosa]|uniref:Uncharacterized protein n=1 Tax=Deinandra increscens subsp. villosa TaxID=3103831 RepID=A0AAP0CWS5_9ASTR
MKTDLFSGTPAASSTNNHASILSPQPLLTSTTSQIIATGNLTNAPLLLTSSSCRARLISSTTAAAAATARNNLNSNKSENEEVEKVEDDMPWIQEKSLALLDWMQHKFRHTNNEPPAAEFPPRNSCSCLPSLDDLQYYPKSHYYSKTSSKTQREGPQFRKSFTCFETAKQTAAEEEQASAAAVFSELFHGFLAIGTLDAETVTNEPKTPTFATFVENNMVKKETEAREKVLEPEGKETGCENNENGAVVCPLQDYLSGTVIELAETATVKKEKEHRTSLGELFQRSKAVEEVTGGKINKTEKVKEKETEKTAVCLMKKILKGRAHYSSSKHSTADKKPHKILQMFHRKVHPEGVAIEPKSQNHMKHVTHGNFVEEYKYRNQNHLVSENAKLFPMVDICKKGANCTMTHLPSGCCRSDSDGNRECWIKSDSESGAGTVEGKR